MLNKVTWDRVLSNSKKYPHSFYFVHSSWRKKQMEKLAGIVRTWLFIVYTLFSIKMNNIYSPTPFKFMSLNSCTFLYDLRGLHNINSLRMYQSDITMVMRKHCSAFNFIYGWMFRTLYLYVKLYSSIKDHMYSRSKKRKKEIPLFI